MSNASRDENRVTTLLGVSYADGVTPVPLYADPVTHRLLTQGGSGLISPLTTKGDIWGFSTGDARVPVGTNGQMLMADSAQALGIKWVIPTLNQIAAPTAIYDFNGQRMTNLGTPTAASDATTKAYVDMLLQGFSMKPSAMISTNTLASSTVSNPTITATANGAFPLTNGYTPGLNDVVHYNAGNAASGLYTLTQVGDGSHPWILTRHVNMDASNEFVGAIIIVDTTDTTNGGKAYICTNTTAPTVGTTAITFTQLFSPVTYSAGTGLTLTSNTFAIDSTVATLTGTQNLTNKTLTSPVLVTPALGVATATSIAAGSISTTGIITETIAGTPTTLTNPTLQATNSVNNFTQISIQNKNATANASADLIAYPDNNTNDSTGFADIGMTSSAFAQAAYAITGANNGYFFVSAVSGASKPGNMVLATDGTGTSNEIVFYTGGFDLLTRERMRVTAVGTRLGLVGTSTGTLLFSGATSGTTTVVANTAAGSGTLTLPTATGNLLSDKSTNTIDTGVKTFAADILKVTSPWITTGTKDANGLAIIGYTATTSAVNNINVANAATAAGPTISAVGSDSNIDLNVNAKGTGLVKFGSATYRNLTTATDGATVTFDLSLSNIQKVTLGGNRTFAFSNAKTGQTFVLEVIQDGTGTRTVTWPGTVKWSGGTAPTLTTTASKTDIFAFFYDGTSYFGSTIGLNY